jgi:hypothetical protein
MSSTHISYDTQSGRIISIHHGPIDAAHARQHAERYSKIKHYPQISKEHVAVMTVSSDTFERGKHYKVDVGRKALVEAAATEGGVGFSFGATGRTS